MWEQINHTAYWKRYILRRTQGKRTRARQAWPPPGRTAAELSRSIADLGALGRELRAAVTALHPDAFAPKGGRYPPAQLLLGEAAHESYHIGQIFLTRKLYRRYRRHRRRAR